MDKYLSFDLGGTKLLSGWVSQNGQILQQEKVLINLNRGPESLVSQIVDLAMKVRGSEPVALSTIASAGPLDPIRGLLLDPTNMKTEGKGWGVFPLIEKLQVKTGWQWRLENDAAAAALAEHWVGEAREVANSVTVTLGTGVGVGIIANSKLLRSGRGLHPEASHIVIEHVIKDALCGCGVYGCAEAYLSGTNFSRWLSEKWGSEISGEKLLELAKNKDLRTIEEFKEYGRKLAIFLLSLSVLFSPEVIILAGGFSHAYPYFLDTTKIELERLMSRRRHGIDLLPTIRISKFQDEAGLIGAASVTHSLLTRRV